MIPPDPKCAFFCGLSVKHGGLTFEARLVGLGSSQYHNTTFVGTHRARNQSLHSFSFRRFSCSRRGSASGELGSKPVMRFGYGLSKLLGSVYGNGNVVFLPPDGTCILSPVRNRVVSSPSSRGTYMLSFDSRLCEAYTLAWVSLVMPKSRRLVLRFHVFMISEQFSLDCQLFTHFFNTQNE